MKIDKSALLQEGSGGGCRQRGAGASSTSYTSITQPDRVLWDPSGTENHHLKATATCWKP